MSTLSKLAAYNKAQSNQISAGAQETPTSTLGKLKSYAEGVERTKVEQETDQNRGGFLGGLGYLGEKVGLGFLSGVEGIWDYTAGGLAKLFGADDWAEQQFANDWVNYNDADEWYNPSDGWKFAGDVAGGIGTSLPAIAGVAAAAAIAYFSGGSLSGVSASLISGSIAGLGAAGQGTKEAYQQTGELGGKEFGYGALVGVTEGSIEALSAGIGAGTGQVVKGIAKSFGKEVAETTAKSAARQTLGKTLINGFVGEAFEEGLSELITPYWKRLTYDPNAKNATAQEIGYAALIGGLSGAIMGGVDTSTRNVSSIVRGNNIINQNKANDVIATAQNVATFEQENKTGYESYQMVDSVLKELTESTSKTGGEITNTHQKMLLGHLERANTAAAFTPMLARNAERIYTNAEIIAERLNTYGYKDAKGNAITFTAEQIKEGIDPNNPQSFEKALKTNSILRTLAVIDATGQLYMDTKRFAEATLQGEKISSQVDLNRFIETATKEELQSVATELGIESWQGLTNEQFHEKIDAFVKSGKVDKYKDLAKLKANVQTIAPEGAQTAIPKTVKMTEDGTVRYTQGGVDFAITKNGDEYRIFNYETGIMSKSMTKAEVNKHLKTIAEKLSTAETDTSERISAVEPTETGRETAEIDAFCRENISSYAKLSDGNKSLVRGVIRQGRVAGIAEADVLSYARVVAHSGINVVFDKNLCEVAVKNDTDEKVYADGYYDKDNNRLVINPETKRTHEALLIHELTHAIYKTADGKLILEKGVKNLSAAEKKSIISRYRDAGHGGNIELIDELNAHYTEGVLTNKNILEKLISEKPKLKEKILSFFKKSTTVYSEDTKLTGAAKKLYNRYKKLFDNFSERNSQFNAVEHSRVVKSENTRQALSESLLLLGQYTDEEIKSIETTKLFQVARSYDDVKSFITKSLNTITEKRLFLGKVTAETAAMIKSETGAAVDGKSIALSSSDIKHIFNNHGANGTELLRGQIPVTEENFENVIETLIVPDTVSKLEDGNRTGVIFHKKIGGRVTAVTIISEKKKALTLKSAWITKEKQSTSLTPNVQALNVTSETGQRMKTVSTNNISENSENVNRNIKKNDKKRYALPTDAEYLVAIEQGSADEVQRMVNIAAKKSGYEHRAYHGTLAKDFTEFKKELIGSRFSFDEKGFFFIDRYSIAKDYSSSEFDANQKGRVIDVFLKIKRPLIADAKYVLREGLGNVYKNYDVIDVWDNYNSFLLEEAEKLNADGIILNDGISKMFVVFEPEQIKSAEPITYSDNGKIIPLSKRFSEEKKDIRYALHDTDSDGRALSAQQLEYFKDSKIRDSDGNLLVVYHGTKSEFTVFDRAKGGESNSIADVGFWFIADKQGAMNWANNSWWGDSEKGKAMPVYLKINNPKIYETTNNDTDSLIEKVRELHRERAKIANKYLYDIDRINSTTGVAEWDAFRSLVEYPQSADYYLNKISEDKKRQVISASNEYKKIEEQEQTLRKQISELHYTSDGYEKFKADLYKIAGQTSEDANIGGSGKVLKNAMETKAKFIESLKNQGYDGVVIHTNFDSNVFGENNTQYLAFDSNQIKLTTNLNPTENEDIRYALDDSDSAEDNNSKSGGLTKGQRAKFVANNTKFKVYSKLEATSVIDSIISERLRLGDEFVGELSGKNRAKVIEKLFTKFNSTPERYRIGVALNIADYIINNATLTDMYEDYSDDSYAMSVLSVLRSYMHRIDLSGIQSEIQYKFDKKNSINLVWGAKKGGVGPDAIAQELEQYGIQIEAENGADQFFEMLELYDSLRGEVNEKTEKVMLTSIGSKEEIEQLRQGIARDVLVAYEEKGSPSKYAKLVEKYTTQIQSLKEQLRDANAYNRLLNSVTDKAQHMRDLKLGTFLNSTQYKSEVFKNSIEGLARIKFRGNFNVAGTRKILAKLRTWYTADNPILADTYEQGIADMLDSLSSGGIRFKKDELVALNNVMTYFTRFVENFNKVYKNGKWVEALPEATRYIDTIHANSELKVGLFRKLAGTLYMQLFGDPMTVARRMDMYSQDGFYTETLQQFRDAAVDSLIAEMEVKSNYDAFMKKNKKYLTEIDKNTVSYGGVDIPKSVIIGLYMTLKRSHAQAGLAQNGFAFVDADGKRVRVDGFAPNIKDDVELKLSALNERRKLEGLLTENDKQYIAILEQAYNVDAKKLKADRDMQRLGFTNATEDYYYPIRRGNIAKNVDTSDIQGEIDRVTNSSFNKDTVKGAKQELFIESADAVFNRHIHAVCQYAYLSPAIEAYNRLFNLDISGNPNKPVSVATESANIWPKGNKYFKKLIADIQGIPASSGEGNKAFSFIRGNYAKFQLGANPKVWVTQLSSLFASSSLLDADSITNGVFVSAKDVDTYCSLAKLRNSNNTAAMAQGVLDKIGKVSDVLMAPIGKMDRFVVRRLFGACQVQVEKNGGAKIGTEANKTAAGELLRQVILETQQNSIATERSAAMRSGNEILRTVTMFTADSMKVVGRVIDAIGELSTLKAKLKVATDTKLKETLQKSIKLANKKVGKSVTALVTSALFMATTAQLFRWLYDKDEKDEQSKAKTVFIDFAGNLLGGLPLIKDIYARIAEGYDFDNYAYSSINDLLDSALGLVDTSKNIVSGDATEQDVAKRVKNLTYSLGQMFGIPTRNLYNVFYGLTKRTSPATAYKIDNKFYKKNYVNDLNTALENDDAEMVAHITSLIYNQRVGDNVNEQSRDKLSTLYSKGYSILPKSVGDSIRYDGTDIELNETQKARFKSIYSQANRYIEKMLESKDYERLSEEKQAKAIKSVYDAYYYQAVSDLVGQNANNTLGELSKYIAPDKLAVVFSELSDIESDVDGRGKTVAGSRKKKTIAYLLKQNLSDGERLLILYSRGYTIQDREYKGYSKESVKRILLQYILSLKKTTQAEKTQLAEKCGFEVKNGRIIRKSL